MEGSPPNSISESIDASSSELDAGLVTALSSLSISVAPPSGAAEIAPLPPSPSPTAPTFVPTTALFSAPSCTHHTYIRTRDASAIVERPQRLRAVAVGFACALARLEEVKFSSSSPFPQIDTEAEPPVVHLVPPIEHDAIDLRTHVAARYVHAALAEEERSLSTVKVEDPQDYLTRIHDLILASADKVAAKESEIPAEWPQGDLYLSPGSLSALQSSLATVCAAIDQVCAPSPLPQSRRAFAPVRPPGHHCSAETPAGFCFVNNVAIASAHAYLEHGIDRIAILDIDLHHGNGTQSLAWSINAATQRQVLTGQPLPNNERGLQIYYGSLHDALSYPCETGDLALLTAASVSLHGPHGQYIENVHLEPYTSPSDFWDRLYPGKYKALLQRAGEFFDRTNAGVGKSLVLVSCGFDASEHELPSMSRHSRHVPTGFYARFAHDARELADMHCMGRVVTVLEGGYGDRALVSGAMSFLSGMACEQWDDVKEDWWSVEELVKIEKAFKSPASRKPRLSGVPLPTSPYLTRAVALLPLLFSAPEPMVYSAPPTPGAPQRMGLRERKVTKPAVVAAATPPRAGKEKEAPKGRKRVVKTEGPDAGVTPLPPTPIPNNMSQNGIEHLAKDMENLSVKFPLRIKLKVPPDPSLAIHPSVQTPAAAGMPTSAESHPDAPDVRSPQAVSAVLPPTAN